MKLCDIESNTDESQICALRQPAFSNKVENHAYQVALHIMHYNFARIHKTLRVTPAMEAGIADHVWSIEEIAALLPTPTLGPRGPYKKKNSN